MSLKLHKIYMLPEFCDLWAAQAHGHGILRYGSYLQPRGALPAAVMLSASGLPIIQQKDPIHPGVVLAAYTPVATDDHSP